MKFSAWNQNSTTWDPSLVAALKKSWKMKNPSEIISKIKSKKAKNQFSKLDFGMQQAKDYVSEMKKTLCESINDCWDFCE